MNWKEMGGDIYDRSTAPEFPSFNIADCLRALFSFPYGIYGFAACLAMFAILMLFIMKMGGSKGGAKDSTRNFAYSRSGSYGTAGFLEGKEADGLLEICDVKKCMGTILGEIDGKVVALPDKTYFNKNMAVYGASGSMKSRAFGRNMILQTIKRGGSLVITDPKQELYEDTAVYARKNGYTVRIFNLVNPENSDSWDCLGEIENSEQMAQTFVDVVIENTGSGKGDRFWDNGELNLLKALVLYVSSAPDTMKKTLPEVYKMLTLNSEAALNNIFDRLPVTHPAKAPYNIFKQASETVRSGIIIGLGTRLQVLQNGAIQNIISHKEIDLALPGRKKCIYYVVISDQDSAFEFISSLFFSFLFIKLVRFADSSKGRMLPVPVHILGDEWPNIGTVVDLPQKISTIRSRNLSISIIFQNLPQLQNRYPDNQWQEILGNCDTTLFLGCTDPLSAKFISDRAGEATIEVDSISKMLGSWRISDYTPEFRETSSVGRRKLLTMDEVLRLPMNQALIILRGQNVLQVNKYDYTKHPDAKKLVECRASEHIPTWRHYRQNESTQGSFFNIPQTKKPVRRARKPTSTGKGDIPEQLSIIPIGKESIVTSDKKQEKEN